MIIKLLSTLYYFYKQLVTPRDYSIISEELEYEIDHDMKYQIEDDHMILHNKGHYAYLRNVEDNLVFQTFFGHNGIVRSLNYFKDLVVTGSDD